MLEFSSTNNDCGCNPENLQQFSDPSCPSPSVVTWQSLQGKPSCFTPCAHTHVPGDIIGLEAYIQSVEFASSVTSTNSIQLTTPSGVLNANLKLSANAGTGYKVPLSILSDGLIGQIPYASGVSSGILSSTDWNIFNNKFNTPSGTVFQYVRGDGSLATFPSFVPYIGATTNVNLGTWGLTLDKLSFNTTPTQSLTGAGQLVWNNADGTLDLRLKGNNVTLQIGQEQLTRVVNKTGADLLEANYQVVKVDGAQGNRLKVALAQANNDANSAETLGIVTETIFNNQEGFITTSGLVRNINTTGSLQSEIWNDGDMLYLSGTIAGRLTNVKPVAPIHTVIMGYVVRAHATQGQIYVKVDNGYELDELHNVLITTPTNGQALVYESSTQLWKNQTVGIPAFTTGSVPFGNGTGLTQNNSKFFWDNTYQLLSIGSNTFIPTDWEKLYLYDSYKANLLLQGDTVGSQITLKGISPTSRDLKIVCGTTGASVLSSTNIPLTIGVSASYTSMVFETDGVSRIVGGIATQNHYVNVNSLTVNVAKNSNSVVINTDPIVGISAATPLTIILPQTPYDGQEVGVLIVSATGTISLSSGEILVQGFGGASNVVNNLPETTGALSYGISGFKYKYVSNTAKWYRIY